jgi:formylglycine-generating enzyme required for sulfatase activity
MTRAIDLLERIAEAVLPALGEPSGPLATERFARSIWAGWSRESDQRRADIDQFLVLTDEEVVDATAHIVKRLLPGQPAALQMLLSRYLHALPDLLQHRVAQIQRAEDLVHWLPSIFPKHQIGEAIPALGDRRLTTLLRADLHGECWLANNPRLPHLPPVLLVFLPEERLERAIAWHNRAMRVATPGLLALEHTFPGCLQFAPPGTETLAQRGRELGITHARLWAELVRLVAGLHRRGTAMSIGAIDLGDVFVQGEQIRLLMTDGPTGDDPRGDVRVLGRLGRQLGLDQDEYLAGVLTEAVAEDALRRPVDAQALLTRAEQAGPLARVVTSPVVNEPARPTTTKRGRVWDVLAGLESGEVKQEKRLVNSAGMPFALIPKGSFAMGSPADEAGRRENEGPVHEVVLPNAFYLAVTPVTQEQYARVTGNNPARFQAAAGGGPTHPVEMISWDEAVAFCTALSNLPAEREARRVYRLPTEAEWEYACRAGTRTAFHQGASLGCDQAHFDGAYPYGDGRRGPTLPRTVPVGSFPPNTWGLSDMHGNVWEWCADWFEDRFYQNSPRSDPRGPDSGIYRVLRGGSWKNQAGTCRAAYRNALAPNQRQPFVGFRVLLVTSD